MARLTPDILRSLAIGPHQLIRRDNVLAQGHSAHSWRTARANGFFDEVMPGVGIETGRSLDPKGLIAAAVAAAGEGAMASHRSAAYLYGADVVGHEPIDVLRTDRQTTLVLPRTKFHRPRDLVDLRPREIEGISVTNPLRTLLDLGVVSRWDVDRTLQIFVIKGLVTFESVDNALMRHSQHGRHGVVALRQALHQLALHEKAPDSVLEEEMARVARRFGLPPMEFHARVAGYEVDFLLTGTNIYLECEGWRYHGLDKDQFEFDRVRTAKLLAAGYIGVRFTWAQIVRRPSMVAQQVKDIYARWKSPR
jgi:very-short-patch-repair endonuclease